MNRQSTLAVLMAAVLTAVLIPVGVRADQNPAGTTGAFGIEGAWLVTIHGESPDEPQREVAVFGAGGVMLVSSAPSAEDGPAGERTYSSGGYGAWTSRGNGRFAFTFASIIYTGSGDFAGTVTIEGRITLDASGNALSGEAHGTVADKDGLVLATFDAGSFTGSRLTVPVGV